MERIALLGISCGICCKTGHFHVTAAIAPNRSHATQASHTKPGRRHEKQAGFIKKPRLFIWRLSGKPHWETWLAILQTPCWWWIAQC
jgi:hypothetical protein